MDFYDQNINNINNGKNTVAFLLLKQLICLNNLCETTFVIAIELQRFGFKQGAKTCISYG